MKSVLTALSLWWVGGLSVHAADVIISAQRIDEPNETVSLRHADELGWQFGGPMWQNYTFFITERPNYLQGSDRVLLSYEDAADVDYRLTLELAIAASVFIMIDDRVASISLGMPWVAALGFVDTGDYVTVSEAGPLRTFSIYRADLPAGQVTFQQQSTPPGMTGMYGLAALPLVPEPSAVLLLGVGTAITLARRRAGY